MQRSRAIWDMGTLPFHVGPQEHPRIDAFPARLPFVVGYDDALGLVTQVHDPETLDVLHRVYAAGSQLGIPMGDHGLGKAYARDFQGVIEGWLGGALQGASMLEIGCGSGHLLGALAWAGADASGVEPDPRCGELMRQRGIPVATCEFEDFRPQRSYDCIVHYCVLEHATDPVAFLVRQRDLLEPGGRIVLAVPDCGAAMALGDVSILIHQHWSYFTGDSLRRLAGAASLRIESLQRAAVGGLLYAELVPDAPADPDSDAAAAAAELFVERGRRSLERLHEYVVATAAAGRSLGIYCPTRAINYAPEDDPSWRAVRLFDDAPLLLGKFVPPFAHAVESGDGLERQPVDEILIMSRAFGHAIEAAIAARPLTEPPRIRHIDDVLRHE